MDQLESGEKTYPWYLVLWLTGVDYFSSLAYQPGIALIAAGMLAPTATLILVAVTVTGALPVYAQVARRSYAGQGSIAMLENLLPGWWSKIFVLVLLGFAATDFVITMTLSAADAARHAIANPLLHSRLADAHMSLTLGLLVLLALVFLIGFGEAIQLATLVAIPYLLLNLAVLIAGFRQIARDPGLIANWRAALTAHTDWTAIFIASALIFPKLALGLSGFETGVSVVPLIADDSGNGAVEDDVAAEDGSSATAQPPLSRIRNSRKLLASAAIIMGVFLVLTSFVTTLLIPPSAYQVGGAASGRAPAYLAHRLLGDAFGTAFDFSTIAILWFAGASAMAGLVNLIPRYLPRFGMAPRWVSYRRPMVLTLFVIDVIVTLFFHGSVEAQAGAYATGVLVLIFSAAVAVSIALWREFRADARRGISGLSLSGYFWLVSAMFAYTLVANVLERPEGVVISAGFIFLVLTLSAVSRYQRARELRVSDVSFADQASANLWNEMKGRKVHLVPYHGLGAASRARKAAEIRDNYKVSGPLAFLHVDLIDNRSEFIGQLKLRVRTEGEDFLLYVSGAVAVANSIAYMSELIEPISVFLTLSGQSLMKQSLRYLLMGEGETGLMVYTILVRYWEWAKTETARPTLYLMSD